MRWVLIATLGLLLAGPAEAQMTGCSQTVGTAAAALPFSGTARPSRYLEICNAHATNTLGINTTGGTAAIGAAGTLTLGPGACKTWNTVLPTAISVIGSAASTTTACSFF